MMQAYYSPIDSYGDIAWHKNNKVYRYGDAVMVTTEKHHSIVQLYHHESHYIMLIYMVGSKSEILTVVRAEPFENGANMTLLYSYESGVPDYYNDINNYRGTDVFDYINIYSGLFLISSKLHTKPVKIRLKDFRSLVVSVLQNMSEYKNMNIVKLYMDQSHIDQVALMMWGYPLATALHHLDMDVLTGEFDDDLFYKLEHLLLRSCPQTALTESCE